MENLHHTSFIVPWWESESQNKKFSQDCSRGRQDASAVAFAPSVGDLCNTPIAHRGFIGSCQIGILVCPSLFCLLSVESAIVLGA